MKDVKRDLEGSVASEFARADLGDVRRVRRLASIAARLSSKPGTPFPRALATEADLQGFYRFVRNKAVTFERLLQPHVAATVERIAEHDEVLALHDTSEFRFGGTRTGLGRLSVSGHGFLGHFTMAVTADGNRSPLGTLAVEAWGRHEPTPSALRSQGKIGVAESQAMPNEQDRWFRSVEAAEAAVGEVASVIHIMDSEADDYDLMGKLVEADRRWVIRLCYDRVLAMVPGNLPRRRSSSLSGRYGARGKFVSPPVGDRLAVPSESALSSEGTHRELGDQCHAGGVPATEVLQDQPRDFGGEHRLGARGQSAQ